MKILQVVPSLASGGAERFVVNLSNQLKNMGHTVVICTLHAAGDDTDSFNKQFLCEDIACYSIPVKGKGIMQALWLIRQFVFSCKPDIVHCHLAVIQYFLLVFCRKKRPIFFHTIHSLAENASGNTKWHSRLFRFLYKNEFVKPVTISEMCHTSFEAYYQLDNDVVIENGVSPLRLSSVACEVKREVDGYKRNLNMPVFVHVARFHEDKNQKLLIDVFNSIEEHFDFCLLVIGRGFDDGEGLLLRNLACGSIHFLGEKDNVGDYLSVSDFFCLTSSFEGLPLSLLEAISLGVVPICTPVGGMVDVVQDGLTGVLATGLTVEEYREAVFRAMNIKFDRQNIRTYYDSHFSMERCAKRYLDLYNENNIGG